MALSPMMKQYLQVKQENPDCILMFRLGDFYEMFYDDAITASKVLDIVLTGRDCGEEERAPMCGIPFHAADSYIHRLIKAGYRVAVAEQMEDPKSVKGIVRREVIRVISPGTVTDGDYLPKEKNNFIMAVYSTSEGCGAAYADVSTGSFSACQFTGRDAKALLISETAAYFPTEALVFGGEDIKSALTERFGARISAINTSLFKFDTAFAEVFSVTGNDVGKSFPLACTAAGALLNHLRTAQKLDLKFVKDIHFYDPALFLQLDSFSRRNLELTESAYTREKRGSLLWVLDDTKTAMGARALRRRLEAPLLDPNIINARLDGVAELVKDRASRDALRDEMSKISDLERLSSRVAYASANPRDLKALEGSMRRFPEIKQILSRFSSPELERIHNDINPLTDVCESIGKYICDDPPVVYKEGGVIRKGAHSDVDELRDIIEGGKNWIARIEKNEREQTGIKNLKIGYNRVFGYYIEVPKAFADAVPQGYIRRQTLADKERYVTEELKDMESRVINARGRLYALEAELFTGLVTYVNESLTFLRKTAEAIAEADVYSTLATVAEENGYTRPEVDVSDVIEIKGGRHPVVEKLCGDSYFVPNDCSLNTSSSRLHIITGPNMAGKSTYMRQVADIVLMAQAGCFVPAESARIGVVDRIFTRVGASDDLSGGTSTFMLEMKEVAQILANATKKSLIVYDEICRGTATYDGMSIARAVVAYTAEKIKARTLFATHYHELTELEGMQEGVVNYNIAAKKRGNEIIFLRRIVRGHASDSYGIEVASLAGVPTSVVNRAKAILKDILETTSAPKISKTAEEADELTLFDMSWENMKEKIKNTDINTITPIEAMGILYEIKKMVE